MPKARGYPVVIIGAGRGGTALLEMFLEDSMVSVIAIADTNTDAQGLRLAKAHGIATYADPVQALLACQDYPDCIVYNLSHDDTIADRVSEVFAGKRVASGLEVKLFWQMITNLKQTKLELEKTQYQLQAIIDNAMDGIITMDESGMVVGFNPAAEEIFGYAYQYVLGKNVNILLPSRDEKKFIEQKLHACCGQLNGVKGREIDALRKSGEVFPLEVSISELNLAGYRYFVSIVRDITERKNTANKIAHLAHYDCLTDLPNRASFMDILDRSIAMAKRNKQKIAVMFLDLDGFKKINDTLGHDAGDLLLKGVALRLRETIRDPDVVSRIGGDEFVFVLEDIGSDENAATVANKIIQALSVPFDLKGQVGQVGGSIGIAIFPADGNESGVLLKCADAAMYLAKQSGKNRYKFFR